MMNTNYLASYTAVFFITALLLSACSTSRPAAEGGPSAPGDDVTEGMSEEERELQQLLDETRDRLADANREEQLQVPPVYSKQDTSRNTGISQNPNQGFRIQLLSTRDVQEADTVSAEFDKWIRETFPQYPAQSYVSFKQPYYKVHVGDFRDRKRAIGFTKIVKEKYPGAWIVPDRINPSSLAPDSVHFVSDTTDTITTKSIFN